MDVIVPIIVLAGCVLNYTQYKIIYEKLIKDEEMEILDYDS